MFKSTLIIAPHADDEVLGCGGFIWKQTNEKKIVDVVVVALGGIHHPHLSVAATHEQRYRELDRSCGILGCQIAGV